MAGSRRICRIHTVGKIERVGKIGRIGRVGKIGRIGKIKKDLQDSHGWKDWNSWKDWKGMKRWTGLAKLCRIYRIGRTSLRHPQDTKDIIFVCVLTIVSELFITIIIIIFVISSESQALPSACLCCDSQLLVRDPALCRTHQPKISSHSSTRSFPASLLSLNQSPKKVSFKIYFG